MVNHTINRVLVLIGTCAVCLVTSASMHAQELQLQKLQRNIDIFSGVLEEALELEQTTQLFGLSVGGIESTYLYGQGVVLTVRTPLSSQRNRLSLASLNSALQSMQSRANPFESIPRPTAPNQDQRFLPLSLTSEEATGFYREMMEKIANIDYSLIVNSAIQQASESARSLRSLGNIDAAAYDELRTDIDEMRDQMQEKMAELREIETEIRQQAGQDAPGAVAESSSQLQLSLDAILANIEPIRQQAIAKADELKQRTEIAEQEYAARWQEGVTDLETRLYAAMCDYGSTLRELPEEESISVVLTGLGEDSADNRRSDRVHVFKKADVLQCQSGDIDVATLQQRSAQYSY